MSDNFWVDFWKDYGSKAIEHDPQTQVLRTRNNVPIDQDKWEFTLAQIMSVIDLKKTDSVLDLCAGNGLLSLAFAGKSSSVTSADISPDLMHSLASRCNEKIKTLVGDIRQLYFAPASFDKVVLYAGIQYLSENDAARLFKAIFGWLRPDGILFIGDIPDFSKKWEYFNSSEREDYYFNALTEDRQVIGTWYEKDFLLKLGRFAGFRQTNILPQDPELIYADFRYDLKAVK